MPDINPGRESGAEGQAQRAPEPGKPRYQYASPDEPGFARSRRGFASSIASDLVGGAAPQLLAVPGFDRFVRRNR